MSAARKPLQSIKPTNAEQAIGLEMLIQFEQRISDGYFNANDVSLQLCSDLYHAYINVNVEEKEVALPKTLHDQLANLLLAERLPTSEEKKKIDTAVYRAQIAALTATLTGKGDYTPQAIVKKAESEIKQDGINVTLSITPEMIFEKRKALILQGFGVILGGDFDAHPSLKEIYRKIIYPCYLFHEVWVSVILNYERSSIFMVERSF